jgi:hypothetical protein
VDDDIWDPLLDDEDAEEDSREPSSDEADGTEDEED